MDYSSKQFDNIRAAINSIELKHNLTNYFGTEKSPVVKFNNKENSVDNFIRFIQNESLVTIFKVGFNDLNNSIVDSSKALYYLNFYQNQAEYHIRTLSKDHKPPVIYIGKLKLDSKDAETSNPDYKLYLFFTYLYFTSENNSKQSILDIMLTYSITKKYAPMLQFVFSAIVSQRQLRDGIQNLKYSQFEDLDAVIKCYTGDFATTFSGYENSTINKVYIDSYTDCYSEALDYQTILERKFNETFKDTI